MDWELEEEILLVSLFFKCKTLSAIEKNNLIRNLSEFLIYRAKLLNYQIHENFRNVAGIKMKLGNILHVDSYGSEGLSQCSELDKQVVHLYKNNRNDFDEQFNQIMEKYKINNSYNIFNENKQKFRDWLINIKKSCITKRSLFLLCEVDEYALNSNISKISVWEIFKVEDLQQYKKSLVAVVNFNYLNKATHYGYTIALAVYLEFLKYKSEHVDSQKASEKVETYSNEETITISKPELNDDYLYTLRDEFWNYLRQQYPNLAKATIDIHKTDAYFLRNNDVGISLTEAIVSDETLIVARNKIRDYLINVNKVRYPKSGAYSYLCSLRLFKEFISNYTATVSTSPKVSLDNLMIEKITKVISTHFANGFRVNSPIELTRFRTFYINVFGEEILYSDEELLKHISACGITCSGKIYVVSTEATEKIRELAKQYFDNGAQVIFYTEFYVKNENWLFGASVVCEDMLIGILRSIFPKLMFTQTYFGYMDTSVFVALESEILRVWGDDILLTYGQLADRLQYIPIDRIISTLGQNGDFIWSSIETFSHTSQIEITEDEREVIREAAVRECNTRGYAPITCLPFGNISERNYKLSDTAIHSAVYRNCLSDKFDKKGKIITRKGDVFDALSIMKEYCRTIDKCTLDDLLNHVKELTGEVHRWLAMDAGNSILVRIDEDNYVSYKYVHFHTDAIDAAIGLYVKSDYLPLQSFTTFGAFPECGQPWNLFLLESYCRRFSLKFLFDSLSTNSRNAGVVIRKSCALDYTRIMIDAVASADIPLNITAVGGFLFDNGYTGRRTNTKVGEIINKARAIRERRA